MSLDERFNAAVEEVKTLTKRPTDDEFLELYALFKQANFSDNNTTKPGLFDLKAKAKWNAWNDKKGLSEDKAKDEYINFVEKLKSIYA